MRRYVVLTNRKRAIVALVHSVAFLGMSAYGLVTVVRPLHKTSPASAWAMFSVYLVVSTILAILTAVSGSGFERLYFGFCTSSATFGLLRQTFGDPRMHAAVYVRIAMLGCAVITGLAILKEHRSAYSPALDEAALPNRPL